MYQTLLVSNDRNPAHIGLTKKRYLAAIGKCGSKGCKGTRSTRCPSSLLASSLALLSDGHTLQGHKSLPQPQAIPSSASNPRRKRVSSQDIPGKGLLPLSDSDWLAAFPSLNQPLWLWGMQRAPTIMTLTSSRGEVALQTPDAGREMKEQSVVPSHNHPT